MNSGAQEENLERVSARIARYIIAFVELLRSESRSDFHMEELTAYVREQSPETAPDSPSRILRELRLQKVLNYTVINRRESHYRLEDPVVVELKSKSRPDRCTASFCAETEALTIVDFPGRGPEPICPKHLQEHSVTDTAIVQASVQEEATNEAVDASEALASIKGFEIVDNDTLEFAAEILADVKGKNNRLEEMKHTATKPMNEALKAVRSWFAPAQNHYAEAEVILKNKIAAYHREIEVKRAAAIAKIDDAADSPTITIALAELGQAQKPVTQGVSVTEVWDFEIVNASLLPREFLMPDEKKIKAASVGAGLEIPGVRRFKKSRVASRAK